MTKNKLIIVTIVITFNFMRRFTIFLLTLVSITLNKLLCDSHEFENSGF